MHPVTLFQFTDLSRYRQSETLERKIGQILSTEEDSFPSFLHYRLIRDRIKTYLSRAMDASVLEETVDYLTNIRSSSPFMRSTVPNCLLAIQRIQEMRMPSFSGITFSPGEKVDLAIGGIIVHIVTDATLSWLDANGAQHIGTIKTKLKKGNYPRESAEMSACLLDRAMHVAHPEAIIDPMHCLCFDPFRQRFVSAVNMDRHMERAEEIARMIASRGDLAA
jgi:hypothetical protein